MTHKYKLGTAEGQAAQSAEEQVKYITWQQSCDYFAFHHRNAKRLARKFGSDKVFPWAVEIEEQTRVKAMELTRGVAKLPWGIALGIACKEERHRWSDAATELRAETLYRPQSSRGIILDAPKPASREAPAPAKSKSTVMTATKRERARKFANVTMTSVVARTPAPAAKYIAALAFWRMQTRPARPGAITALDMSKPSLVPFRKLTTRILAPHLTVD